MIIIQVIIIVIIIITMVITKYNVIKKIRNNNNDQRFPYVKYVSLEIKYSINKVKINNHVMMRTFKN